MSRIAGHAQCQSGATGRAGLIDRQIVVESVLGRDAALDDVLGDADDSCAWRRGRVTEAQAFAERICVRPEPCSHAFADDDDPGRAGRVAVAQPAAVKNARAHHLEIPACRFLRSELTQLADRRDAVG